MIKTQYPVIFNTFFLPVLSADDPAHFTVAALHTFYSKVAGKKVADTADKNFSEALWPDPIGLMAGSFQPAFHECSVPPQRKPRFVMPYKRKVLH